MILQNNLPTDVTSPDLRAEQRQSFLFGCLHNGLCKCTANWFGRLAIMTYCIIAIALCGANTRICNMIFPPTLGQVATVFFPSFIIFCFVSLFFIFAILFGMQRNAWEYYRNFVRAGIINSGGEAPLLIDRLQPTEQDDATTQLTFETRGIPLEDWQDHKSTIESALNHVIVRISYGKNRRTIVLNVLSGDRTLPDFVEWEWRYLPAKKHILALGESVTGTVTVNLHDTPHMLIAGSTGSGKSILLKAVIAQCIAHGDRVLLADLKGLDFFNLYWLATGIAVLCDTHAVKATLATLTTELRQRAKSVQSFYANPANKGAPLPHMSRIVFVCDEITALTDKTGLDKDSKAEVDSIVRDLTLLATQGRAFNINLILSTQRPDADAIPGKIKNNLDSRICGKSDNTLSVIVLDNADANDCIPKDSHGIFLTNDGTLFKGYYFEDAMLDSFDCTPQ